MGYWDNILKKELQVVELDGSEKTWIGGVYCPPVCKGDTDSYLFIRCITKDAAKGKETKSVTLKETNGCYTPRYWTNIPEFWDNHAVATDAPETLWEYDYYHDVFEHETILEDWLQEEACGFWDDGFTEWGPGEFEEKCDEYVASHTERNCHEIPFKEWINLPKLSREEWLNQQ